MNTLSKKTVFQFFAIFKLPIEDAVLHGNAAQRYQQLQQQLLLAEKQLKDVYFANTLPCH
jgi:hypothetical protein